MTGLAGMTRTNLRFESSHPLVLVAAGAAGEMSAAGAIPVAGAIPAAEAATTQSYLPFVCILV